VLGIGEPLYGKLLTFDGLTSTIRPLTFPYRSGCKDCGHTRHDLAHVAAAA